MKSNQFINQNRLLMILLVVFSSNAFGSSKTELRKTVSKEFAVDKLSSVEMSNRYGKVEVKTWDRNFVKVDVAIIVKSNDKSVAQEKIDLIKVDLSKINNAVVGVTSIEEAGWSWSWFGASNVSFEINYIVQMPNNLPLIVENKYGNIYIPEMANMVSINLKYGALEACNINGPLRIDMAYSKAVVGNVGDMTGIMSYSNHLGANALNANIEAKYSKVSVDNVSSLSLISKYNNLKLGNIGTLTLTADYDECKTGVVSKAKLDMDYTDISILSLTQSLTADIDYGSLTIHDLASTVKTINISTRYAPIKIQSTNAANIDVKGSYFDANLGANFVAKTRVKEGSKLTLKGYKGYEKSQTQIIVDSKYGDVDIY